MLSTKLYSAVFLPSLATRIVDIMTQMQRKRLSPAARKHKLPTCPHIGAYINLSWQLHLQPSLLPCGLALTCRQASRKPPQKVWHLLVYPSWCWAPTSPPPPALSSTGLPQAQTQPPLCQGLGLPWSNLGPSSSTFSPGCSNSWPPNPPVEPHCTFLKQYLFLFLLCKPLKSLCAEPQEHDSLSAGASRPPGDNQKNRREPQASAFIITDWKSGNTLQLLECRMPNLTGKINYQVPQKASWGQKGRKSKKQKTKASNPTDVSLKHHARKKLPKNPNPKACFKLIKAPIYTNKINKQTPKLGTVLKLCMGKKREQKENEKVQTYCQKKWKGMRLLQEPQGKTKKEDEKSTSNDAIKEISSREKKNIGGKFLPPPQTTSFTKH